MIFHSLFLFQPRSKVGNERQEFTVQSQVAGHLFRMTGDKSLVLEEKASELQPQRNL